MTTTTPIPTVRLALGFALGVLLMWVGMVAASLPTTALPTQDTDLRLYDARPGSGVTVSFVETGTARIPGWMLHQGAGLRFHDVVFRAALIEHPERVILFGSGVSATMPSGRVYNPFGRVTMNPEPALPTIDAVVLPTPRWFHTGGVEAWSALADVPIHIGQSDAWQASSRGPWPGRYAMEPERIEALGDRVTRIPWTRRRRMGAYRSLELVRDGSVIAVGLKGSSIDEVAILVTLDSGRRVMLVGDAVWAQAQVEYLLPRALWSTWLLDRNRMQVARLQAHLHQAWRDHEVTVVPLLDGTMSLPVYPDRWN